MRATRQEVSATVVLLCLVFGFLLLVALLSSCKSGYRAVEKMSADQPDRLESGYNRYKSPRGVEVWATKPVAAAVLDAIDAGVQDTLDKTTRDFTNGIEPVDTWRGWSKYKKHADYRFLVLDKTTPAISPEIAGCPLVSTWYSATGFASGVTGGWKWSGYDLEEAYPMTLIGNLDAEQLSNPACVNHVRIAARHEAEHWRLANNPALFLHYQINDIHPIF